MTKTFLALALIPLILSIGLTPIFSFEFLPEANALKSKGTPLTETGSKKVCGDRLCSEAKKSHGHSKQEYQHDTIDSVNLTISELDELAKYRAADLIAKKHLETFDELDFEVFTKQQWERLHESHSEDIIVHWPDGRTTEGIEAHIEDLKFMFAYAPDTRILQHPIKIASGPWTSVIGIIEGTFTEPMPLPDGSSIPPTNKPFKLTMNTVGYWENGVMTEEFLFWDNLEFMKQIGIADSNTESTHAIHPEKMRTAAPLPETSLGPQIDYAKGYLVEEIKDGLYWVTEGAYQAMFLTTGQGVIVVDAPPTIGENYLKAIAEVTDEPITHVIYSHTHNDHVGSMTMFPDDAVYIAHQDAADTISKRNDPNRPVPDVTFENNYVLQVGNQKLELAYYGPMHEPGNIFIYAPSQKVLMLVDVIFPGWTPFKDLAMAQDVTEFLAAHDKVLEYDFETFIGGHLTRLGTPEDVQIQKEYFQDIQAAAAKANQEVSFMEIGQEVGFSNPWLVFQIYADTITQQCTDDIVPKWIDRLGGVDLFTYDHCWKISEAQRID